MKLINALTSDPNQSLSIVLDDGSHVDITLTFKDNQAGWFYSISYGTTLNVQGRRLVNSPNILRAFRNIIPFGIACIVTDGHEPVYIDDFTNARALIYIMNEADVLDAETVIQEYKSV